MSIPSENWHRADLTELTQICITWEKGVLCMLAVCRGDKVERGKQHKKYSLRNVSSREISKAARRAYARPFCTIVGAGFENG